MANLNYGKYRIPPKLIRIISLQNQLEQQGVLPHGDLLGFYFELADLDSRYLNTPLDLISFARPGVDGIHYGFLTDFGGVGDLEDAYIVRVSPMDFDEPVKIVARNLQDFLRILCFTPNALDILDITTSEAQFKQDSDLFSTKNDDENQKRVREILQNEFSLEPIENLYHYLQQVKLERLNETLLATEDGIGVAVRSIAHEAFLGEVRYPLKPQKDLNTADVRRFFDRASYPIKLAFLRDVQSKGLIFDQPELKNALKQQLLLMKLADEAVRIDFP
ncbi:hypothetical protein [Bacillus sp. MRMR6]|uniref:hypothetical protein n=1 Tax=Bacillus sp. MRMR6 TaxID=1928617 RepID=UPI0009513D66|nr:hypothetical protein [Bacillus sp. MRMR6]OLS41299.1 hypothetical protein BTR25_05425 [Bacillus sp. MRMR6]